MDKKERERQRRMAEQLGDMEFQAELAPYFNYRDVVDPKMVDVHGEDNFPEYLGPEGGGTVVGVRNTDTGMIEVLPKGANAQTLAHEVRHGDIHDEQTNRMFDLMGAQDRDQWQQAVDQYIGFQVISLMDAAEGNEKVKPRADSMRELFYYAPFEERERWVLENVVKDGRYVDDKDMERYGQGSIWKQKVADYGNSKTTLPDNYSRGGRVKLI